MHFIISWAPESTFTLDFFVCPITSNSPAGIRLSFTSPLGVFITTADLLPIRALAIGTICFVSSEVKLNNVAIPYGFDNTSITLPIGATSIAANIPIGTLSIKVTSSTIGILWSNLLFIKTPSSFFTIAPFILNILL